MHFKIHLHSDTTNNNRIRIKLSPFKRVLLPPYSWWYGTGDSLYDVLDIWLVTILSPLSRVWYGTMPYHTGMVPYHMIAGQTLDR